MCAFLLAVYCCCRIRLLQDPCCRPVTQALPFPAPGPMSPSLLLLSVLSRQISAMMMSGTVERGALSTGPSNGWNDDDDGHPNDADADGSYRMAATYPACAA